MKAQNERNGLIIEYEGIGDLGVFKRDLDYLYAELKTKESLHKDDITLESVMRPISELKASLEMILARYFNVPDLPKVTIKYPMEYIIDLSQKEKQ